jgi:hypothetical protein
MLPAVDSRRRRPCLPIPMHICLGYPEIDAAARLINVLEKEQSYSLLGKITLLLYSFDERSWTEYVMSACD